MVVELPWFSVDHEQTMKILVIKSSYIFGCCYKRDKCCYHMFLLGTRYPGEKLLSDSATGAGFIAGK